jgi:hypothetical protein
MDTNIKENSKGTHSPNARSFEDEHKLPSEICEGGSIMARETGTPLRNYTKALYNKLWRTSPIVVVPFLC